MTAQLLDGATLAGGLKEQVAADAAALTGESRRSYDQLSLLMQQSADP